MKKIVILSLLLALSVFTQAQISPAPVISNGAYGTMTLPYATAGDDTATNTDVISMTTYFNGKYDLIVRLVNTKVSGTLAGFAYCQGSWDNTNWITLKESGQTIQGTEDSVAYTDASLTYIWTFADFPFRYFRLVSATSGTNVSAPVGVIYYRKEE